MFRAEKWLVLRTQRGKGADGIRPYHHFLAHHSLMNGTAGLIPGAIFPRPAATLVAELGLHPFGMDG